MAAKSAPPPDTLSFATYGDPLAKHAFGESFLTQMFPVGSVVPALDFRMPAPVESQYDTHQFVSAYDSIADWPDRPDNWMSLLNAVVGLATGHTASAAIERSFQMCTSRTGPIAPDWMISTTRR